MRIIDAHMHFSRIESFSACAKHDSMVDYTESGYADEARRCDIAASICMGLSETRPGAFPDSGAMTPMLADLTDQLPEGMLICPGINPHTLGSGLPALEELIQSKKKVVGLKIYAGYYHLDIFDEAYRPAYRLAEKYGLTVAIHTGDTYSDRGLLAYAHPIHVDRLAVEHRDLRIVICHLGVPWIYDGCEVAAKNKNVYLDISGLLVGGEAYIRRFMNKQLVLDRYIQALEFLDNYEKILFGTDWPLAPMGPYIEFCKMLVPPSEHEKVFFQNACDVYGIR